MGSTTGTLDELEKNRFKPSHIWLPFQLELSLFILVEESIKESNYLGARKRQEGSTIKDLF